MREQRDLKADLEICNKATPGPWKRITKGNTVQSRAITTDTGECGIQKTICASISTKTTDDLFIASAREGWPEAIRRAIEAEEHIEMLSNECDMCKNDKEAMALETISALREENDQQRHSIQHLSAQVVELREALDRLARLGNEPHYGNSIGNEIAKQALSQPDPGAEIMERMKKLEAVVEAANELTFNYWNARENGRLAKKLQQALAALAGDAPC